MFLLFPILILYKKKSCIVFLCFSLTVQSQIFSQVNSNKEVWIDEVLNDFKVALDERWSYRYANNSNFDSAIVALKTKAEILEMSIEEIGLELSKIIALGIDGHSGITGYKLPGNRYLPFLIEPIDDKWIAFRYDHSNFLVDDYPYLEKIDGKDIREFYNAALVIVPKGSSQYQRHRGTKVIRNINFIRGLIGLQFRDSVDITLLSNDKKTSLNITLPLSNTPLEYIIWPQEESKILEYNIGYLRLTTMRSTISTQEIRLWMPKFKNTIGLIIDVRDNSGGDRDALQLIYSYLAVPNDPPRVFTASAYRLNKEHPKDYLALNHRMHSRSAPEWSHQQGKAIDEFTESFAPEWIFPEDQFSDWHYMVLSHLSDTDIYYYDKPVIVLMNGKSFSATDIFLAGLKGIKNVTLIGTPSAGGSAFTQEIKLGNSLLNLRIGTMVSFQSNGKLFDGNGVQPDIIVKSIPEYFIGRIDNILEYAINRLRYNED